MQCHWERQKETDMIAHLFASSGRLAFQTKFHGKFISCTLDGRSNLEEYFIVQFGQIFI